MWKQPMLLVPYLKLNSGEIIKEKERRGILKKTSAKLWETLLGKKKVQSKAKGTAVRGYAGCSFRASSHIPHVTLGTLLFNRLQLYNKN